MSAISTRARSAVIALGLTVAAGVIVMVSDVAALPLLDDLTDIDALNRFDTVTGLAGLIEILALVAGAVFFVRWFNLVHRSLDDLSPGVRRHATWWSIGGWFVPIWSLFRPKQILDDMLVCAHGEGRAHPWWAPTWWGLWLLGSLGGNIAGQAFFNADTVEALRSATVVDAVASAILVAGGVVAIIVVRQVTEAIELKRRSVDARDAIAAQQLGSVPPPQPAAGW